MTLGGLQPAMPYGVVREERAQTGCTRRSIIHPRTRACRHPQSHPRSRTSNGTQT